MNESVLYTYLSGLLHTNVRILDKNANLLDIYTVHGNLHDNFADSREIALAFCGLSEYPKLYTVNNLLTYVSVPILENYCVLGPVSVCADCLHKIQLPELFIPKELVGQLHYSNSTQLIYTATFLYNLFADTPADVLTCRAQNCTGSDIFDNSLKEATKSIFNHEEYGNGHNSYESEKREMLCVEYGNLQQLHEYWNKEDISRNLGMLSRDPLQNAKYLSIINVNLTARAAIRGGIPFELAYSLCDAYCQQIDVLNESNFLQVEGLIRNIQLTFTQLVAQQNGNSSNDPVNVPPLVARAKEFIFSHLHGKITLIDVADALKTHPNYLNRIFKQSENITIYDYILREKLKLVCNMLTYSEYSYIDIANYFGFASQSHLGNKFKKYTGMTLKQYRDAYHKF